MAPSYSPLDSMNDSSKHDARVEKDLLNGLFESRDPADVMLFYDHFQGVDDLVEWMKTRPSRECRLEEVDGDKEIVVVVPTTDFESRLARRCRLEIFSGIQIVFVVDQTEEDGYFNLARNYNLGLARALRHSPRWIVWSNDDMYKIDEPEVLTKELESVPSGGPTAVFTQPSAYHSVVYQLASSSIVRKALLSMSRNGRQTLARERKFGANMYGIPGTGFFWRTMYNSAFRFRQTCAFGIMSSEYVKDKGGHLFDETYGNAVEDVDFSIGIAAAASLGELTTTTIDYLIGDEVGGSLGVGMSRSLRNLAGTAYLNYKIRNGLLDTPKTNTP